MSSANGHPMFDGLDSAEQEILERELREGRVQLARPIPPAKPVPPVKSEADKDEIVSKVDAKTRNKNMREFHEAVLRGEVDLGPAGHAADPLPLEQNEDVRDKRDPNKLGASVLGAVKRKSFIKTASEGHDMIEAEGIAVPDFDPGESTVTLTQREYRTELEARAATGDKYAISMLTTGQPGDSAE